MTKKTSTIANVSYVEDFLKWLDDPHVTAHITHAFPYYRGHLSADNELKKTTRAQQILFDFILSLAEEGKIYLFQQRYATEFIYLAVKATK